MIALHASSTTRNSALYTYKIILKQTQVLFNQHLYKPYAKNPELSKVPSHKPGVSQMTALHASSTTRTPTTRNSALHTCKMILKQT